MPLLLQKIFMLQRHQLLRWGTATGYAGIFIGLLFIVITIFGLFVVTPKLEDARIGTMKTREKERTLIIQSKDIEELRSFTLEGNSYNQSMESIYWDSVNSMVKCVVIFFLGTSVISIAYGMLSLRVRELADELEETTAEPVEVEPREAMSHHASLPVMPGEIAGQ